MILKRGNCSTVEEIVCNNTGMTREDLLNDRRIYQINGLEDVRDKIIEAMQNNKKIYVFGDYDVDGICAASIIKIGMTTIAYADKTIIRLPKRFSEGYGVSETSIDEFESDQILMTVDNGISAHAAIKKAKEKGMYVIVVDHHLPQTDDNDNVILPEADMIIDPKALPGSADFDGYCGAGLAYRIMCKLVHDKETLFKMLCLAAIATIADRMPLTGENRRIVKYGLSNMTNMKRTTTGLYALLSACECSEYVTEDMVAFKIAPCLNAPGRLFDYGAYESFKLLSYDGDLKEARIMAEKQVECNATRRAISDEWITKAKEYLELNMLMDTKPVVIRLDDIPEGIIGIVAGKIAEYTKSPCILFALSKQTGKLKGSARTYGNIHLLNMIKAGSQYLDRFGGHKEAAGLLLSVDNFDAFRKCMENVYEGSRDLKMNDNVYYDLEVNCEEVEEILNEITRFGPYGQGNPAPVLYIRNIFLTPVGSSHYRYLGNRSAIKLNARLFDCISFDNISRYESIGAPMSVDVVGKATLNCYMGDFRYQIEFTEISESTRKRSSTLANLLADRATKRYMEDKK